MPALFTGEHKNDEVKIYRKQTPFSFLTGVKYASGSSFYCEVVQGKDEKGNLI